MVKRYISGSRDGLRASIPIKWGMVVLLAFIFLFVGLGGIQAVANDTSGTACPSAAPGSSHSISSSNQIEAAVIPGLDGKRVLFIHEGSTAEGSISNTNWDGYSKIATFLRNQGCEIEQKNLNPITANDLSGYDVVVFSNGWKNRLISNDEAQVVVEYVYNGGGLYLMTELGVPSWINCNNSANKIGSYMGIQFDSGVICDDVNYQYHSSDPDGGVDLPLITNIASHDVTKNVGTFTINWGSSITVSSPAQVLAYSGPESWLDTNAYYNSGGYLVCSHDSNESRGARPVLAVCRYGLGKVVALGDKSSLVNAWVDDYDHYNLICNILCWLSPENLFTMTPTNPVAGQTVTFDASYAYDPDGIVVSSQWDFGDGTPATGLKVDHVYSQVGEYTVTLSLVNDQGITKQVHRKLTVGVPSGDTPYITGVELIVNGKYRKNTENVFFNGTSLPATINAKVYWRGNAGTVKFIKPNNEEVAGSTLNIDLGTEVGAGGKIFIEATDPDGKKSPAYQVPIFVVNPPAELTGGWVFDKNLDCYVSQGQWFFSLLKQDLGDSSIPKNFPLLGGKQINFEFIPIACITAGLDGKGKISIGEKVSNQSSISYAGQRCPLVEKPKGRRPGAATGSQYDIIFDAGMTFDYNRGQEAWNYGGGLGVEINGMVQLPPYYFYVYGFPCYIRAGFGLESSTQLTLLLVQADPSGASINPYFQGSLDIGPYVRLMAGAGAADVASIEGYGKGKLDFKMSYNGALGGVNLDGIELQLEAGVKIVILCYSHEFKIWNDKWPDSGGTMAPQGLTTDEIDTDSFDPLDRTYLKKDNYGQFHSIGEATRQGGNSIDSLEETASTDERILQENVYPYSQPTIVASGSKTWLFWLYDDPARTSQNRTKLVFSKALGDGWSYPQAVKDDGTADYHPSAAVLPDGRVMVVWENSKSVLQDNADLDAALPGLEIAWAIYDPASGSWTDGVLTNNSFIDHSPQIAAGTNGSIVVTWIQNTYNNLLGSNGQPSQLMSARWKDGQWTLTQTITAVSEPLLNTALCCSGGQAVLVWEADTDNDLNTQEDRELFKACLPDAGDTWTGPEQLTSNSVGDRMPQLVDNAGTAYLAWIEGENVVMADPLNSLANKSFALANPNTAASFRLIKRSSGLALLWNDLSQEGADIYSSIYDASTGHWGQPKQLTRDDEVEQSIDACFVEPDKMVLIYNKAKLYYPPEGLPEVTQTDLAVLTMQEGSDLSVDEIKLSNYTPSPGETMNIGIVVTNRGEVAKENIPVLLYQQSGEGEKQLICSLQIPGPLLSGQSSILNYLWTVPDAVGEVSLIALIDPVYDASDRDRSNDSWSVDFEVLGAVEGGSIAGKVFDSNGSPLQGITVQYFRVDGNEEGGTTTDERGSFAFPDLVPGTYKVKAFSNAKAEITPGVWGEWSTVWYNQKSEDQADEIWVTDGTARTGINFTLTLNPYEGEVTSPGKLTVSPEEGPASATGQSLSLTYVPGEELTNGTVVFNIPAAFSINSMTVDSTSSTPVAMANGIDPTKVTVQNVSLKSAGMLLLTLNVQAFPATTGLYYFSAAADADGTGEERTPSSGSGFEQALFTCVESDTLPPSLVKTYLDSSYNFHLVFNKAVSSVGDLTSLKKAITRASDGILYDALSDANTVEIQNNDLIIGLEASEINEKTKINIAAGSLQDAQGHVITGDITVQVKNYDPPRLLSVYPEDSSTRVPTGAWLMLLFSELIRAKESPFNVTLTAEGEVDILAEALVYDKNIVLIPQSNLAFNQKYLVNIAKDSIVDMDDKPLENDIHFSFTTVPHGPDLIVSALSAPATGLSPGAKIKLSYTVLNQGPLPSLDKCRLNIYTGQYGPSTLLGSVSISKLKNGKSKKGTVYITLPNSGEQAGMDIYAWVDDGDNIIEEDEQNNVQWLGLTLQFCDLSFSQSWQGLPANIIAGQKVSFSDIVVNQGQAASRKCVVTYYLWDGIEGHAKTLLGSRKINALKPGKTSKGKLKFVVPSVTPGTYTLLGIIDETGSLCEHETQANNTIQTQVTIS